MEDNKKEIQNKDIINVKIPSFMNDLEKTIIINQRNIEDDKCSELEQAYKISQNYYNNIFWSKRRFIP